MTVAKLPSPPDRLRKGAKKAHRLKTNARIAMLEAEIASLKHGGSSEHARQLDLAKLHHRRAHGTWVKAENLLEEATS